jgi:hypothetical protein
MTNSRALRENNGSVQAPSPGSFTSLFDDFLDTLNVGALGWTATTSGGGAAIASVTTNSDGNHPGIKQMTTGPTATGRCTYDLSLDGMAYPLASGELDYETLILIPTLSTAAQRYVLYVGFGDVSAAGDQTDGVYFEYDEATSANWRIVGAQGGTRTKTTTATAVVAAAFIRLRMVCVPGTATFFVNNTQVGTITTNLPGAGQFFGPIFKLEKTVGGTARTLEIDYFSLNIKPGTPR